MLNNSNEQLIIYVGTTKASSFIKNNLVFVLNRHSV